MLFSHLRQYQVHACIETKRAGRKDIAEELIPIIHTSITVGAFNIKICLHTPFIGSFGRFSIVEIQ